MILAADAKGLNCKFEDLKEPFLPTNTYHCKIVQNPSIKSLDDAQNITIIGTHLSIRNHDAVKSFLMTDSSYQMHYLPRGLNTIFQHLISIRINDAHLKELTTDDLAPFTKLVVLDLHNNDLEILEENVFKYNTEMLVICLVTNKIIHVGTNVFDHLSKLVTLGLSSNKCISSSETTVNSMKVLINNVYLKCANASVLNTKFIMNEEELENVELNKTNNVLRDQVKKLEVRKLLQFELNNANRTIEEINKSNNMSTKEVNYLRSELQTLNDEVEMFQLELNYCNETIVEVNKSNDACSKKMDYCRSELKKSKDEIASERASFKQSKNLLITQINELEGKFEDAINLARDLYTKKTQVDETKTLTLIEEETDKIKVESEQKCQNSLNQILIFALLICVVNIIGSFVINCYIRNLNRK